MTQARAESCLRCMCVRRKEGSRGKEGTRRVEKGLAGYKRKQDQIVKCTSNTTMYGCILPKILTG